MKSLLRRLLSALGLATASQLAHANARARQAGDRAAMLEDRLARARADAASWKQRQHEAAQSAAEWKKAAGRSEAAAEKARGHAAAADARADEWKQRADALTVQVRDLRGRLEDARRVGTIAREHLMATEVKLDLVEAAIQVLDARTREASLPRS